MMFDVGFFKKFSENTTNIGGAKQICGITFLNNDGEWAAIEGDIKYILSYGTPYKCRVTDTRDGYSICFITVYGAKAFAKRRRHGRTIEEHKRAEKLLCLRDGLNLKMSELAEKSGVSPRTLEAYFSGCRAVPVGLVESVASALRVDSV